MMAIGCVAPVSLLLIWHFVPSVYHASVYRTVTHTALGNMVVEVPLVRSACPSPHPSPSARAALHLPNWIRGPNHGPNHGGIQFGGDKHGGEEGGWWLCGKGLGKDAGCVVYSFGINDDWTFDKAISEKYGCITNGFDPSPAGLASKSAYEKDTAMRKYSNWGLGTADKTYGIGEVPFRWPGIGYLTLSNTQPWALKTVSGTMRALGHSKVTVLKMDVEGAEWFAVEDMVKSRLIADGKVEQFCVELHFHPKRYKVMTIPDGEPGAGGFAVIGTSPDDMDYIGLLKRLLDEGLTLWTWKYNADDKNCVEASFIVDVNRKQKGTPGVDLYE